MVTEARPLVWGAVLASVLVGVGGCIVVRPPETPATSQSVADGRKEEPDAATPTISDVIATCAAIQRSREIPVSCEMGRVEGLDAMVIGFGSAPDAQQLVSTVTESVAIPFCLLLNQANRQGAVLIEVARTPVLALDCERREWKAVASSQGELRPPPRATSASWDQAIARCRKVQDRAEIPIGCHMEYIEHVPTIVLGFRTVNEATQYMGVMAEAVAAPFCEVAIARGSPARVVQSVGPQSHPQGRLFDCQTSRWSEWVDIAGGSRTQPAANGVVY